jgi:phosphate transport system permease protein
VVDQADATREAVRRSLSGARFDVGGALFESALLGTLLAALGVLVLLLGDVVRTGVPLLADRGAAFFRQGSSLAASRAGVFQAVVGSLTIVAFVAAIAFPLGVGAAVYLQEYARDTRLTRLITANVRNLAGVPSIVYGLLGLAIFAKVLGGFTGGLSVISGGLTLAVLALPLVIITSMEALRAVPAPLREAGYAVGATRWEVIRSHVLPSAAPGILTGTVLAVSRAFGETAPLILVGASTGFFATGGGSFVEKLQGPYTSLPTLIYSWSRQPSPEFRALTAAAIVVLLSVLMLVNSTAIVLRNRFERK